jgi:prevent-host-death family protein
MSDAQVVNVHQAKTHLSRLLERVAEGEEITIAKAGKPVARLVPIRAAKRQLGMDASSDFYIADDFDAPMSDDELELFEGGEIEPTTER